MDDLFVLKINKNYGHGQYKFIFHGDYLPIILYK